MEAFLAVLLTARSGGRTASVADVQDILARFPALVVLAGFANPNEIAGLVEGLEDALDAPALYARQIRTAAWTLLGDGVFAAHPRTQQRVTELLIDDLSIRLINDAVGRGEIQPLPADRGALPLVECLTRRMQDDPDAILSTDRAQLAARHDPDAVRG